MKDTIIDGGKCLQVGIVGSGIAGLAAAIALCRAGHSVEIFEKSQFKNEVGAAIVVGPNATRILDQWGFDFDRAGALDFAQMRRIRADTAEVDSEEFFTNTEQRYGSRWLAFHRADLHSGMLDLLEKQQRRPSIQLDTSVVEIDVETGTIQTRKGGNYEKDLIVIADGSHSRLVSLVTGHETPVMKSPMSMYRFLQPFDTILKDDKTGPFYHNQAAGFTTFYKTQVGRPGLLLNTYPCRGGQLLYCALLHPTKLKEKECEGWDSPAEYEDVIADAQGFHPSVQAICEGATDVKVYTQMWREPVGRFTKGKAVVIGDAAHLMLPTHGQGASMAIEDAAALEVILNSENPGLSLRTKLELYDTLRLPRVRAVQSMSNKMMGPPDRMIAEVRKYYDGSIPGPHAKTFSPEYNDFFFLYNVVDKARGLLFKALDTQTGFARSGVIDSVLPQNGRVE